MIRVSFFMVVLLTISTATFGQTLTPSALVKNQKFETIDLLEVNPQRSVNVPSNLKNYSVLSIKKNEIYNLAVARPEYIELSIPTEQNAINVQLAKVEINPEGDYVITQPAGNLVKVDAGIHYRGIIKGNDKSLVAMSIYDNELMGLITSDVLGNKVLAKLSDNDAHIIYSDEDIANLHSFECNTENSSETYSASELKHSHNKRSLTDCVKLYMEVDYDIYQKKGGLTETTQHITGLYNQVATLYANENIKTALQPLNIWTQTSPYTSNDPNDLLSKFGQVRTSYDGDLAMLLSYKGGGGLAYVNALCGSSPRYKMGYASITENFNNVPTYSWSVMVVTHELGHLFGSQHTHACVWNGNNTAIDGCYEVEGVCGNPGIPTDGGTIMSYCHLTSAGINLSNGFGTQPGNLIRNRVANATCTSACSDDPGDDSGNGGNSTECQYTKVILTLNFDNYPAETSWQLLNSNGESVYTGNSYKDRNGSTTKEMCIPDGCYEFKINDSYGDGICCTYGNGGYKLVKGSETLAEGGQFTDTKKHSFCIGNTGVKTTCEDGVQNGEETGVDCGGPTCPPCQQSGCTDNEYTLELIFDKYPRETRWEIITKNGDNLAQGNYYTVSNGSTTETLCLPKGCFDFIIYDTYGDGICCSYGNGSFTLKDNRGNIVFTGSKFRKTLTKTFCTDENTNNNEDNTDTCNDGVQNGDETNIDCGGSCMPCDTNNGENDDSTTQLAGHYFENGWDSWIDGGSDCYRYTGQFAKEGSYAIRLRDNSGEGSSMTSPEYDITSFDALEVRFYFYPYSMENGENFFVHFYDGSSWQEISTFVSGTDFNNGQFYEAVVDIPSSAYTFSENAKFKIQCNASNNGDQVYIDAVQIIGKTGNLNTLQSETQPIGATFNKDEHIHTIEITPNPTLNDIYLHVTTDASYESNIKIFDIYGRNVMERNQEISMGENQLMIPTESLVKGTYLLHIQDEEHEVTIKKFVKL